MNAKPARLLAAFEALPPGAVVVEIGCVRFDEEIASDGWSTVHLAHAAEEHGWTVHSIDRDREATTIARRLTRGLPVTVHQADGEQWLRAFDDAISGLYLDGSADPREALGQYAAATLADGAVVVVDDVQQIGCDEHGKADLLLDRLARDGYQVEVFDTEPGYLMAVAS